MNRLNRNVVHRFFVRTFHHRHVESRVLTSLTINMSVLDAEKIVIDTMSIVVPSIIFRTSNKFFKLHLKAQRGLYNPYSAEYFIASIYSL